MKELSADLGSSNTSGRLAITEVREKAASAPIPKRASQVGMTAMRGEIGFRQPNFQPKNF
jgi:hypothetical protein